MLRELPLHSLPADALGHCLPAAVDETVLVEELRHLQNCGDATPRAAVFVAPVHGAGHGLFAAVDLPPFACLGEYAGLITEDAHAALAAPDEYLMSYPARGLHVSAAEMGGLLRFANHAPRGSANIDVYPILLDGAWHMVALTLVHVKATTQLTLDYGSVFWDGQRRTPAVLTPAS